MGRTGGTGERARPSGPGAAPGPVAGPGVVVMERAGVSFGPREVLREVGLRLAPGTVAEVRGANGSGKTTLLRALAGVQRLSAGRRVGPREVAWLPATFSPPRMTVDEWLTGFRAHPGPPEAVLDRLGFRGNRRRWLHELSFGNLRKVALAEALTSAAPLLVLDEASGGLDERGRAGLAALLAEAAASGRTVVAADQDGHGGLPATRSFRVVEGTVRERPPGVVRLTLEGPPAAVARVADFAVSLGVEVVGEGNP